MKMIDLKLPKKKKKDMIAPEAVEYAADNYPWGTQITFDKDQIDKMPELKELDVNSSVQVQAVGFVKEISVRDVAGQGRSRHRIEIQLQKVGVSSGDAEKAFNEK